MTRYYILKCGCCNRLYRLYRLRAGSKSLELALAGKHQKGWHHTGRPISTVTRITLEAARWLNPKAFAKIK